MYCIMIVFLYVAVSTKTHIEGIRSLCWAVVLHCTPIAVVNNLLLECKSQIQFLWIKSVWAMLPIRCISVSKIIHSGVQRSNLTLFNLVQTATAQDRSWSQGYYFIIDQIAQNIDLNVVRFPSECFTSLAAYEGSTKLNINCVWSGSCDRWRNNSFGLLWYTVFSNYS